MKVAISLSDDLFLRAERIVKQKGASRSAIYARALEDYVERNDPETLTEQINRMVDAMTEEDMLDQERWLELGRRSVVKNIDW